MNKLFPAAAIVLLSANLAWAQDKKTEAPKKDSVQNIMGQEKKTRKKKVEMCSECGKPESECECHGHDKKEHKEKGAVSEKSSEEK